jgi:tRNA nucleotidyltransferase (CCA-adding enzyme)
VHRFDELRAGTVHELIARGDGFRKPARIAQLGLVCEADKRGRLGLTESDYPQRARLDAAHRAALAVNARDLDLVGLDGEAIAQRLRQARDCSNRRSYRAGLNQRSARQTMYTSERA